MTVVYFDDQRADDQRRRHLFNDAVFVYSSTPSARALCGFAREMLEGAFHPLEPETAQKELPVERYAQILAELKPAFIHHGKSKAYIQGILEELGCDRDKTYFDVPRLRSSTSDGYLTTGIAYAFHPHRDTWYSAPMCQINWWLPVYPLTADNGMAFHPDYWEQRVENSSSCYNYAQWNKKNRFNAARHIGKDTREQPKASEEILGGDVRIVCEVGGVVVFSAAQMHSSVPNSSGRTRFSIDFRTVHFDDVSGGTGAPNVDSECTGTSLGDFLRSSDLAHISEEWVERYDAGLGR